MSLITSCLWFDGQAEEAAELYVSLIPNSRITRTTRYPEGARGKAGSVMTVSFELDGTHFVGLNGGPQFTFNEAVSFQIGCETQEEVDRYWAALGEGGQPGPCGWLKDRFGVSWQIVPNALPRLLTGSDDETASRVMQAMMDMGKLDVAALEAAAAG